ncbi:MAG TPA: hypothetical protein VLB46_13705 [Pyrinomonadaceae bacterium]|nr:hypothetical protein [Pyrinomonadaceae bacterium]
MEKRPFLILRKIENFGERAYPLVILFDPGRDAWERFEWNGAHLLSALFGTIDAPGIKLLTDPESYHTDEHLAQLLTDVDDSVPQNDGGSEITNPECLLDLWSGSVFAESPLIVPVDAQLTGFSNRPDLTGLLSLINKLPSSLRSGKGWLFGGRDRHAESLGTHLIFDDGKIDPPTDSEKESFIQFQQKGRQFRTTLEWLSESTDDDEESQLKKYLSQPVFEWIDSGDIASLQDIFLLRELKEHGDAEAEKLEELFARTNERLTTSGKLNKEIAVAANRRIAHKKRERTPAETVFILTQGKSKLTDKDLSDLDEEAARSYFIEHKIFPADAVGRMPPSIRLGVSQKLLEVEEQASSIPQIFSKEAALSPGYEKQDLDLLLRAAVKRSATLDHGLRLWKKLFEHKDIGAGVKEVVRARVLDQVNPDDPESMADYLILGDDAGGDQLISSKPEFTEREALEKLLRFMTEQARSSDEPELKQSAKSWLTQLAQSELRLNVSLKQKDEIASILNNKPWLNYLAMRRAFKGESRPSGVPNPDEQEKFFLAEELTEATADRTSHEPGFIPDLERLSKLLEPDYLDSMVKALLPVEPDLTSEGGLQWVEGWLHLAQKKPALDAEQLSECLSKHRSQLVRLILETDTPLDKSELLKELQHDDLTALIKQLLVGHGDDDFLRRRLAPVLETSSGAKNLNNVMREVFDEIRSDTTQQVTLTRRFVGQQKDLTRIQSRLTKEQRGECENLFAKKSRDEIDRVTDEILKIFSTDDQESAFSRLGKVKANAQKVGDDIFKKALVCAVDKLAKSQELQQAFISADASKSECCNFIRTQLGPNPERKNVITTLESRRNDREHLAKISRYVMDGGQERDSEYRSSLDNLLKNEHKVNPLTIKGVNAAVKRALSSEASVQTLIRRFIPMVRAHDSGEESHTIQRDVALDHLFKYLEKPIRRAFLRKLWIHYGKDKRTNPLFAPTRKVYHKVKDDKAKYLNFFDEAFIDFLANNGEFRKWFAHRELGSDKAGSIEDDLGDYMTDPEEEDEPIDDSGDNKSKRGIVASVFGFARASVKELFNGSEVKNTERSQEGDDQ